MDLLSDEHRPQISANRKYLSAVVDVLKFTAIHRLAQRGHDEHGDSVNRGNFLDLPNVIVVISSILHSSQYITCF